MLRFLVHCALTAAAAMFLKWIINRQRVVPHETALAICASVRAAKERFHIMHGCAAAR
jgi:hypothetical protein